METTETQKGQTAITINGKTVGIKFSIFGVEEMQQIKGNSTSVQYILSLIWCGVLGFAYAKQAEPPVTFEEVADWLETVQLSGDKEDILHQISTAFETSSVYEKLFKPLIGKQSELIIPGDKIVSALKKNKNQPKKESY